MPRPRALDQDVALWELGMWPREDRPVPGITIKDLSAAEREQVYKSRKKLAKMAEPVRLPGVEARKYRTTDIDRLA